MNNKRIFGKVFNPDHPNDCSDAWLTIGTSSYFIELTKPCKFYGENNVLLGEFNGLDKVTLIGCREGGSFQGSAGIHLKIEIAYLVKDIHVKPNEKFLFIKMVVHSPALLKWVMVSQGIQFIDSNTINIPENIEIVNSKIENFNLIITIGHKSLSSSRSVKVDRICFITIVSKSMIEIEDFSPVLAHLKKLILFLTHLNPDFNSYHLFNKNKRSYELLNTNEELNDKKFTQPLALSYFQIKESLSSIIESWFSMKKLVPIIDLVLERCYNTTLSPQGFFLSVSMGIEIFQNKFGASVESEEIKIAEQNKGKIYEAIADSELKAWFKGKSAYWTSPTFSERLMHYHDKLEYLIAGVFELTVEEFVTKITRTRNDIVHRGVSSKHFTGTELFLAAKIIEFLIRVETLALIGVNTEPNSNSILGTAKLNLDVLVKINKE